VNGSKPSFEPGAPVPSFDARMVLSGATAVYQYDVTADGERFLVNTTNTGASTPPLTVVVNWKK